MNFINKINKYLLEHYPLIWNTRLVWMLGVNILTHLLFFIIGFFTVNNIEDLKSQYKLSEFFYDTSAVYYNFLISIFVVLLWIVFYLRNNAFKNLYSLPKGILFKQFLIILVISFISISQYFSFKQGLKFKITSLYNWEQTDKDIKEFNRTALFLVQNQDDYEIEDKQYPEPFPLKVAATKKDKFIENVDTTRSYIKHKGAYYQFYKIDQELWDKDAQENTHNIRYSKNDFKYRIVKDISEYKELLNPSLLNYSKEFFNSGQDSLAYDLQIKNHQKILEDRDETEIQEALKKFLLLADKYEIKHNLTVEGWFKIIYNNQPNYLLKELINTSDPASDYYNSSNKNKFVDNYEDYNIVIPYSKTLFLELGRTDYFFSNVHEAYFSKFDIELFYVLIGVSIVFGLILFIFKTTSIKSLLLTFVASLVVLILIVWLMSSTRSLVIIHRDYRESSIMIFISFVILAISMISYLLKWKKIIIHIFWGLALFAFPTFILFINLFYIKYLKNAHLKLFPKDYNFTSGFEIWFNTYGFWFVVFSSFFIAFLYSVYIRKLVARVE